MSKQDVRKEQIALLRFEKQLVELADSLAGLEAVATSADAKLTSNKAHKSFKSMKKALIKLADQTSTAHDSLMNLSVKSKARLIESDSIIFKPRVADVVSSKVPESDSIIFKPRVADAVSKKLPNSDSIIFKPRVADVVSKKLPNSDSIIFKPRVADVVSKKLADSDSIIFKPRVVETVRSKLDQTKASLRLEQKNGNELKSKLTTS